MKRELVGNLWEVKFELQVVCGENGVFMFASRKNEWLAHV